MKSVVIKETDIWCNLNFNLFNSVDKALQNRLENILEEEGFDLTRYIEITGSLKYSEYIVCKQEEE